ncbi:MAG: GspE/PulE family protein [Gemmatimonadota bacterium]|nr:GspE/PulE family protein [Gemmatimonadota bacterium]
MSGDARDLRAAAAGPLAQRFPARWLEEHAVLPLSLEEGTLLVAADGALASLVQDALERAVDAPVRVVPHGAGDIRAAILSAPRAPAGSTSPEAAADSRVTMLSGETTASLDDLRALASREPVIQVVNAMLAEAARAGASDVHVESHPEGLRVRMRLDGVLRDAQQLGPEFRAAVLSRLKVLAGLDIAERRLPQDGRARVRVGDRELDVRIATLPALHGESVVMRLLDGGQADQPSSLESLGLAPAVLAQWRTLLHRPSGLLLVSGPTGSGKTTTLYAALRERSTVGVKVVTVEDPVEYRLDGVVQLPVNVRAGFGFPNALRAILRHDPDVILVGEMRDAETADVAVQAALTGHLVLSTVHTTDATAALARLQEMGVPPYLLSATLQGVLAQRLVRRVCAGCGAWRALTAAERALAERALAERALAEHTRTSVTQVREGAGCAACAGTGFRGRLAISELLVLDDAMRSAFTGGASLVALRAMLRARGVGSLRDDGWRAVAAGDTTIDEVVRVVSGDDDA